MNNLQKFQDILHLSNILFSSMRQACWYFILGLKWLVDEAEKMSEKILTVGGFFEYGPINDLLLQYRPFVWVLLGMSLVFLGYQLMFNKIRDKSGIFNNILIAFFFILLIPTFLTTMQTITEDAIGSLGNNKIESKSAEILKNNIADIYVYTNAEFDIKAPEEGLVNKIPSSKLKNINITEEIDPDSDFIKDDTLENKLVLDTKGGFVEEELEEGWFGIGEETYYRWHVNWFNTIFTLIVLAITLLIIILKIARILYEIAFTKIFAPFVAATDVTSGQRIKQIFNSIISSFTVLFAIALSLKIYIIFTGWITTVDLGGMGFGNAILLLAASLALMDGPNLVEKILGVDAGLKDGWRTVAGTYLGAKAVGEGVSKVGGSVIKGSYNKAVQGAGVLKGLRSGADESMNGSPSSNLSEKRRNNANPIGESDSSGSSSSSGPNGAKGNVKSGTSNLSSPNINVPGELQGDKSSSNESLNKPQESENRMNSTSRMHSSGEKVQTNSLNQESGGKSESLEVAKGGNSVPENNGIHPESVSLKEVNAGETNHSSEREVSTRDSKPDGHIIPKHDFTIGGQNRLVQHTKEHHALGYNTGVNIRKGLNQLRNKKPPREE